MLSHSMIDMNSSSAKRKPAFGKLDSMARKVSTGFQDDVLNEKKPGDASIQTNATNQSMIPNRSSFPQRMPSTYTTLDKPFLQQS